ncbi:hypothetical protein RHGRI_021842 [Rhododendron griersonianum]|uniref:EF-hand domain-containing protein n=1 Tax=Rhododendron griersonianum TaxID=479676 RepID=A0AAV6JRL4_9ERIC|nr:hypothetical protein RHGRI_021842 [Rhododendron griersonianum]
MAPEELARLYDSIFEKFDCDGSMFLHLEEFHFGSPATTARTVAGIVIEGGMVVGEDVNLTEEAPKSTPVFSVSIIYSEPQEGGGDAASGAGSIDCGVRQSRARLFLE